MNIDITTPIFWTNLKEATGTTYVVTLLVLTKFDDNVICTKNPVRPQKNCIFIVRKCSLEDKRDIISDDMGNRKKSKIKTMPFGKTETVKLWEFFPRTIVFFENTWKVQRYIHCHCKSRDFHRVTIFVEGSDFIFVKFYFDWEEHEIDTSNPHGNSNVTKQPRSRTKQSVKISARNLNIDGPKGTVEKLFHKVGGFDNVRSNSDYPKNCKQVSNLGYFQKKANISDDIVDLIDMCLM